jgi:hypothetical protein
VTAQVLAPAAWSVAHWLLSSAPPKISSPRGSIVVAEVIAVEPEKDGPAAPPDVGLQHDALVRLHPLRPGDRVVDALGLASSSRR